MDAMNAVFDAMLLGLETGQLDRRDRVRGFIADLITRTQIGSPGSLQLIVNSKHDTTELVFWSFPGVVINVLMDLTWDSQHGRRLSSIKCETHLWVADAQRDRCREFFEERNTRIKALTSIRATPAREGSADA